jgi:hypothetical protein
MMMMVGCAVPGCCVPLVTYLLTCWWIRLFKVLGATFITHYIVVPAVRVQWSPPCSHCACDLQCVPHLCSVPAMPYPPAWCLGDHLDYCHSAILF